MKGGRKTAAIPIALGFRAGRGGSVVVGVAMDGKAPRVVMSAFLATAAEGDRLAFEPYHVAAEMPRGARGASGELTAAVAEGRRRQDQMAVKGLGEIIRRAQDAVCEPVIAALLVNRAGWITDLLDYSLGAPEHPAVAEGLAVRDALRFACRECGLKVTELDEKSLHEAAERQLRLSSDDLDHRLKALGAGAGRPWRKEQKLACLAAWTAVAGLQ